MFRRISSLFFCSLLVATLCACSDAESPDAFYDAGVSFHADSGPDFGAEGQPCANGNCDNDALVCVIEGSDDGPRICREKCDREEPGDPCGAGRSCERLTDGTGACLPAGGLDEPCPCDQGFRCMNLPSDGGPTNICKTECDPNADGGPDPCSATERCARLTGSDDLGVCIDE